jgi:hypothetical protein
LVPAAGPAVRLAVKGARPVAKTAQFVTKKNQYSEHKGKFGSYTNTHASGKRYHGQGDQKRSQRSGREKAKENDDPHVATDWKSEETRRDAFKAEHKRIEEDGGPENPNNYNRRNSPGKRYNEQDQ